MIIVTLFSSDDEQLNKHRQTPMPSSIIHVFPLKQANVLQTEMKRRKKRNISILIESLGSLWRSSEGRSDEEIDRKRWKLAKEKKTDCRETSLPINANWLRTKNHFPPLSFFLFSFVCSSNKCWWLMSEDEQWRASRLSFSIHYLLIFVVAHRNRMDHRVIYSNESLIDTLVYSFHIHLDILVNYWHKRVDIPSDKTIAIDNLQKNNSLLVIDKNEEEGI